MKEISIYRTIIFLYRNIPKGSYDLFSTIHRFRNLYLQMINPKDSVVWQEKYQDGIANGIKGGIIIGENIGKY